MAAARQRGEVLVARGVAEAVDDDVGAAELRAAPRRRSGSRASRSGARSRTRARRGLLLARHRADHDGAQAARPAADQQADAAGRGVHEQPGAGADVAEVAQQDVGGDALEQQGRGDVVLDRRGQADDPSAGTVRTLQ